MNGHQFLHISFEFKGEINKDAIKKKFDLALDWAHYLPNCWIVKTTSSPEKWYERLKPLIGPNDHLFICKLDLSIRYGWLPKWFWDWAEKQVPRRISFIKK